MDADIGVSEVFNVKLLWKEAKWLKTQQVDFAQEVLVSFFKGSLESELVDSVHSLLHVSQVSANFFDLFVALCDLITIHFASLFGNFREDKVEYKWCSTDGDQAKTEDNESVCWVEVVKNDQNTDDKHYGDDADKSVGTESNISADNFINLFKKHLDYFFEFLDF